MAKLPIRLAGRAAPQIGGPQSQAVASGLGALGQGIASVGIGLQRKQTAAENFNVSKDVLKIQEASLMNQDAVLASSNNSQEVNEGIEVFQKDILNEVGAGKSKGYQEKLKDATLKMFSDARVGSARAGVRMDVNNLMVEVEGAMSDAVRIVRNFPDVQGAVTELVDRISEEISNTVGVTQAQKKAIQKEFDSEISMATLKGFLDKGIHGAMFVKKELSTTKYIGRISNKQMDYMKAQANAQIQQGQKEVLATADTEISTMLVMERGGRDTGMTPENMEAKLQGFGLPQVEIDRRVSEVKRNQFYGQEIRMSAQGPQFGFDARKREIQDVVDALSPEDIATGRDFAIEAMAQMDALNELEKQKADNPYGYALEWIPSLREQDSKIQQLAQAAQNAPPEQQDQLRAELLAERAKFASNLQEQSVLVFGGPNRIPIAGQREVTFFKNQLDSGTAETQLQLVKQQIQAYGPAAAGLVMKTFFNERDQQSWQFIAPIMNTNERGAVTAIAAMNNWKVNRTNLSTAQLSSLREKTVVGMQPFGLSFPNGQTDPTLSSGIGLTQQIVADQILRGIEEDEAIENAILITTGNYDIVDTTRVSKSTMLKFPKAQIGIELVRSGRLNKALSAAAGFPQYGDNPDNTEFNEAPLTAYTSPNGDGIIIYAGAGILKAPVVDHNGNPRVITWGQLNLIGTNFPQRRRVTGQMISPGERPIHRQAPFGRIRKDPEAGFIDWLGRFINKTQEPSAAQQAQAAEAVQ